MRSSAILLAILLSAAAVGAPADVSLGPYHAVIDTNAIGTDVFHLYRSGELVRQADDVVRLWMTSPEPGTDVNADGVPDLVLHGWSGGAHCCHTAWVFSLGDECELLAEVAGEHSEVEIRQADDDPALELVVRDWALAYWPFDFAGSASVEVVLDWDGRTLRPSAALTAAAIDLPAGPMADSIADLNAALDATLDATLDAMARQFAADPSWADTGYDAICGIFATALRLVYAGQPNRAASFIANAWGGDRAALTRLTMEFGRRLAGSRYLAVLERQREMEGLGAR
jgi:hypothetical protein